MGERDQHGAAPTGPEPSQVEPPSGVSPLRASVSSAKERVRHVKHGTEYDVLYRGVRLQISVKRAVAADRGWLPEQALAVGEDEHLVIYRGDNGLLWAREEDEFDDGRFESVLAPCDEPRHGGDASAAPGRSPAGAVPEGQAPDLIDELGDEASILLSNDAPYCAIVVERAAKSLQKLQAENDRLTTALAESERKRVEAMGIIHDLIVEADRLWLRAPSHEFGAALGRASEFYLATPTQETPDDQG